MEKKYRKCLKKKKEKEKNANCKMPERPYPEGGGLRVEQALFSWLGFSLL